MPKDKRSELRRVYEILKCCSGGPLSAYVIARRCRSRQSDLMVWLGRLVAAGLLHTVVFKGVVLYGLTRPRGVEFVGRVDGLLGQLEGLEVTL
jgi:hypothetical protein